MSSNKNRNSLLLPKNKNQLKSTLEKIGNILVKNKILEGKYTNKDAKSAIEAIASQLDPMTRKRNHRNSLALIKNPKIRTKSRKHRNSLKIIREKLNKQKKKDLISFN